MRQPDRGRLRPQPRGLAPASAAPPHPGRTFVLADTGARETFEQWVARYGLNRLFAYTINSERDG